MTVQAMLVFASIIRCVESVTCTNKNIYLFLPKRKKDSCQDDRLRSGVGDPMLGQDDVCKHQ